MKKKITISIRKDLISVMDSKGYSYSTVIDMALESYFGIKEERSKGLTSKQQEMKERGEKQQAERDEARKKQEALWREEEAYCKSKGIPFVAPGEYVPAMNESKSREEMIASMNTRAREKQAENGYFGELSKRMMGRKLKGQVERDVDEIDHLENEGYITTEEAEELYRLSGEKLASFAGFEEIYE